MDAIYLRVELMGQGLSQVLTDSRNSPKFDIICLSLIFSKDRLICLTCKTECATCVCPKCKILLLIFRLYLYVFIVFFCGFSQVCITRHGQVQPEGQWPWGQRGGGQ